MAEIFTSNEQATPRELAERFASAYGVPDLARGQLLRIVELAGATEAETGARLRDGRDAEQEKVATLMGEVERLTTAINTACGIIERGDNRLLAQDGPCNNQPPAITLDEWCAMYTALNTARSRSPTAPAGEKP